MHELADRWKPEAIARDIVKRFLPVYLPILAKAKERRESTNAHAALTKATLAKLVKITGSNHNEKDVVYGPACTLQVSGDYVRFEHLGLSGDDALEVARLLVKLARDRKADEA